MYYGNAEKEDSLLGKWRGGGLVYEEGELIGIWGLITGMCYLHGQINS